MTKKQIPIEIEGDYKHKDTTGCNISTTHSCINSNDIDTGWTSTSTLSEPVCMNEVRTNPYVKQECKCTNKPQIKCQNADWSDCAATFGDDDICDDEINECGGSLDEFCRDHDDKCYISGYAFAYPEQDEKPHIVAYTTKPNIKKCGELNFNLASSEDLCCNDKSIDVNTDDIRSFNVGASDYSKHKIQPWDIWEEYDLNPWEADIVKRVLREKAEPGMSWVDSRILDFQKIIHVSRKCIELLEKSKNSISI